MACCWLLAVMSEVGGKMEEEEKVTSRSSRFDCVSRVLEWWVVRESEIFVYTYVYS